MISNFSLATGPSLGFSVGVTAATGGSALEVSGGACSALLLPGSGSGLLGVEFMGVFKANEALGYVVALEFYRFRFQPPPEAAADC